MKEKQKVSPSLRISLIYALIGGLWVLLSDRVVGMLFSAPGQILAAQQYKGWFYVGSTALLLFVLLRNKKNSLERSEQNYHDLFEAATEGIFRSSPEGRFIDVNPAMAQIFGYASPEEMIEQVTDIRTQIHLSKESRLLFTDVLDKDGMVDKFEAMNRRKDGSLIWTSTNARVVRNRGGGILYYEGFVTDITKQKNAENALTEAEKRYRMLVENLPAVVFMDNFHDDQNTYYMSPRIYDLLGYTPQEWEGGNYIWENSLHPEDKERVLAEDKRTNQTGEPFRIEYRLRHRNGHYVWVKEDATIVRAEDGAPLYWHGILLDITNQKKAEESIHRRDAILKAVGFSAEQFLKSSDWRECLGVVLEELGKATRVSRAYVFKKYLSPENIVMVTQVSEWSNTEVKPQIENPELQVKDFAADGFSRWIEHFDKGLPIYGSIQDFPEQERVFLAEQDILSLVCLPLQIGTDWWGFIGFDECSQQREWAETEMEVLKAAASTLSTAINKKLTEEALQDSEVSYRGLFNSIQDAIYVQSVNGIFLDVNGGAVKMYGYDREEFIGKTPAFLAAPGKNDMDKTLNAVQRAFAGEACQFEFWGMRKNGEVFPKDVHLFKGTYFGQVVVIAVAQDITSRKNSEEAMQRHLKELTVLHAVALAETTTLGVDELFEQVTSIIGNMLYPDNCGVILLNEKRDMLIPHPSYRGTSAEDLSRYVPVTMGITGKVATSGEPSCVADVSREADYYMGIEGMKSELCVPLSNGRTIIGVLNVESRQPNAFTQTDERLLTTIAGGMAKTIERIELFELEQKRRKLAEVLSEATGELTAVFEMDKLYENIFNSLAKLIGYDSACIEALREGEFEIIAGKNLPEKMIGVRYKADIEKWGEDIYKRQPIIIADVQQDERFEKFEETRYIRGWMGIPMFAHDEFLGFLDLNSRIPGFFTEENASIVQTFGNQAAIAMENARLFELERHRRAQAEILNQATSALANTLDMDRLFKNILDWLQKIAPYDSASITLSEGNTQRLAAKRGLPRSYHIGQIFEMKPTDKWRLVAKNRKPLILEDAQENELFEKWQDSEHIRGWMCAAMFVQDKLMGFINLDSRTKGAFTEELAIPLQTFANQAAVAIDNARLFELEQKRRKNAEIIRQAATILTTLLDLPALYEAILEWLYRIVPYDSATIFELEGDRVRISAARGISHPEKMLEQTFPADNTLCKIMDEMREPLIIEDCEFDSRFERWGGIENVHGWMGVPLISRGQAIGYITLDSHTPGAFNQNDAITAQTFAHQAATSLENSRLFTETKQRLEELEVVSRISFALRAARDTEEMLPILMEEAKTSMGSESAAIWLYEFEDNELKAKAVSGQFKHLNKMNFKPGEGVAGTAYSTGTAQIITTRAPVSVVHEANRSIFDENWGGIVVPIRTASETIGALGSAVHSPRKIESHHIRLMTTLAEIAGNAIYRSNLYRQSEEQIKRLTTLRELDTAIASSLDLRLTLGILTEHLLNNMGVSASAVLIFNPTEQTLEYCVVSGFKNQKEMRQPIKIGNGLAGQIMLNRRAFFLKDLGWETESRLPQWLRHEGFKSYYAVPLFSKGAIKGILETYFRETFSPGADWIEFIHMLAEQAVIAIDNAQLFESLQQSNQELSLAYDRTLEGWGKALELRDKETQGHTERVTALTLELAIQMDVPEASLLHIRRGCLLHDIGKMGVPDHILRKDGKLTEEELAEMRKHTQYAYDMISPIEYLRPALDIAYCHHEWWDGNGYPRGLRGEEIPLSARIFAVIDVWDALSSDRPYRKAWDYEKILEYIRGLSGKQFDPEVVDAFFSMIENESKFFGWK